MVQRREKGVRRREQMVRRTEKGVRRTEQMVRRTEKGVRRTEKWVRRTEIVLWGHRTSWLIRARSGTSCPRVAHRGSLEHGWP